MKKGLSSALLLLLATVSWAQVDCDRLPDNGYFGPKKETITLDYLSGFPEGDIPFDRWFYVKRVFPKEFVITSIAPITDPHQLNKRPGTNYVDPLCFEQKPVKDQPDFTEVTILIPPLKPNSSFGLIIVRNLFDDEKEEFFTVLKKIQASDLATAHALLHVINDTKSRNGDSFTVQDSDLTGFYNQHLRVLLDAWVASVSPDERATIKREVFGIMDTGLLGNPMNGKSIFRSSSFRGLNNRSLSFDTRTKYTLVPDFGYFAYGFQPDFKGSMPYVGVAINFRSFDPDVPLSRIESIKPWYRHPLQFLSLNVGLTLGSVSKTNYRENLLGSRTLITGVGIRLTQALKINPGVLWYNQLSDSPLIDRKSARPVFYVGLSLDFRLKEVLKDVSAIFTGNFLPSVR